LCDECADRIFPPTEEEPPPRPEERFEELFRAAQALFEVGEVDEDVVYPTLVFANETWQNLDFAAAKERLVVAWDDPNAWREEVENFARAYNGFNPVRVVHDVLFLELQPASAVIRSYQTTDVPKEVEFRVFPRRKPASSEEVAAAYEEALSDAGVRCDVSDRTLPVVAGAAAERGAVDPRPSSSASLFGEGETDYDADRCAPLVA
jgi:hypothetical protein